MKRIKNICTLLIVIMLLLIPQVVHATENEPQDIETGVDDQIDETQTPNEDDPSNDSEISDIPEETIPQNDIIDEMPPLIQPKETETKDTDDVSYGWLNIESSIDNSNLENEIILTFEFTNIDTNEIINKELSSLNLFQNIVKLPLGTYNVVLKSDKYEENIVYDKTVTITRDETKFKLGINGITSETKIDETIEENNTNVMLELLKNNIFFLIILVACGVFLLVHELRKRKDYN